MTDDRPEPDHGFDDDDDVPIRRSRRRHIFLSLVAMVIAVAFLGAQIPLARLLPDRIMDVEAVLGFVERIALLRETPDGPATPGWVRKWATDVQVYVEGVRSAATDRELGNLLRWAERRTGRAFRLAETTDARQGQVLIRFLPHAEMRARHGAQGPVCVTWTLGNGGALHRAYVEVSERYADCLAHEFMHVLGADNHWSGQRTPTVLVPRGNHRRTAFFSEWDEVAIRLLYHPDIAPGMMRARALATMSGLLRYGIVAPSGREGA